MVSKIRSKRYAGEDLLVPANVESNNYSEVVYTEFDAILDSIYNLVTNTQNKYQEMPTVGFDLSLFLFRTKGSPDWDNLVTSFQKQVKSVCGGSSVTVTVEINDSDNRMVDIIVRYYNPKLNEQQIQTLNYSSITQNIMNYKPVGMTQAFA